MVCSPRCGDFGVGRVWVAESVHGMEDAEFEFSKFR